MQCEATVSRLDKTEILALGSLPKWPRRCSAAEGTTKSQTAACGARRLACSVPGTPPGLACSVPGTCARTRLKHRAPARGSGVEKLRTVPDAALQRRPAVARRRRGRQPSGLRDARPLRERFRNVADEQQRRQWGRDLPIILPVGA